MDRIMTTLELKVTLPDDLARRAKEAGLLSSEAVAAMLSERLRARHVDELFVAMDRMAAVDAPAAMSPEEVAGEIAAIRAERRAKNAG